jgi:hypothetical protein
MSVKICFDKIIPPVSGNGSFILSVLGQKRFRHEKNSVLYPAKLSGKPDVYRSGPAPSQVHGASG